MTNSARQIDFRRKLDVEAILEDDAYARMSNGEQRIMNVEFSQV